jgi:Zn-dependent peptidase ImmA (M78 family)
MSEHQFLAEAKNKAAEIRHKMSLGFEAVAEIFHLIEEYGLPVARRDMKEDGPDGIYANNGEIAVAVINTARLRVRQRFTAAHEFGHHLFDSSTGLQVDENVFQPQNIKDKRANAFAANFLMPEDGIRNILSRGRRRLQVTPNDIVHLCHHFGVSHEAIIYQVQNIGLITASERDKFLDMNVNGTLKAIEWKSGYLSKTKWERQESQRLPTQQLPIDYVKRAISSYVFGKVSLSRLAELLEWHDVKTLKTELEEAKIEPPTDNIDE